MAGGWGVGGGEGGVRRMFSFKHVLLELPVFFFFFFLLIYEVLFPEQPLSTFHQSLAEHGNVKKAHSNCSRNQSKIMRCGGKSCFPDHSIYQDQKTKGSRGRDKPAPQQHINKG